MTKCSVFPALVFTLFVALSLTAKTVSAMELGASAALTTDYVFRGISQTDENPAVQASFEAAFENGIYLSLWGSNVDFDSDEPTLELDYTAGYTWEWAAGRSLDLGVIYYDYPGGDANEDYLEGYVVLSISDFSVGLNYSDDYFGETGQFWYLYAGQSFLLGKVGNSEISLNLHVGSNFFDSDEEAGAFFAVPTITSTSTSSGGNEISVTSLAVDDVDDQYLDWAVGLSTEYQGFEFSLNYHDTDLDSDVCDALCDSRVVFTISKSF